MKNVNSIVLQAPSNATQTGSAIDASQIYQVSLQGIYQNGDEAGTLKVQMSNDPQPAGTYTPFTPTNWVDVPNATSTVTSGAGTPIILSVVSSRWLRVVYTSSSGGAANKNVIVEMFGICV